MAPPLVPLEERFARLSFPEPNSGCWIWEGKIDWAGYGHIKHQGRDRKAATVAFELAKGPVPNGLEISHLCASPWCVNPDHLIAETHSENLKRRRPFDHRTYGGLCKQGHVLPPISARNKNKGCPICYAEYQAVWKAKNAGYQREYDLRNRDAINAKRRARRHRAKENCYGI